MDPDLLAKISELTAYPRPILSVGMTPKERDEKLTFITYAAEVVLEELEKVRNTVDNDSTLGAYLESAARNFDEGLYDLRRTKDLR